MSTFYISGPISLYLDTDRNVPAFLEMEHKLDKLGFLVENPIHNPPPSFLTGKELWQFQLRKDLAQLVKCDAMVLLPDWQKSDGSKLELFIALKLGLKIYDHNLEELNVCLTDPDLMLSTDASSDSPESKIFLDPFGLPRF
jgi:hypothetical protein